MANILIVDDDSETAEAVCDLLTSRGHSVRSAHGGEDALRLLKVSPLPNVVILDVEMPILDGPAVAHRMLLHDAGQEKIPILLVSGHVDLPQIAKRMGTPYFLRKPSSIGALVDELDKALKGHLAPSSA